MKKQILINLILLSSVLMTNAQQISLPINDWRDENRQPSQYSREAIFEFKKRTIIGVPGEGLYSGLFTIAPWADNSGNKTHQLNFNDGGIFYRQGLHGGSWENWSKLLMVDSSGNLDLTAYSIRSKDQGPGGYNVISTNLTSIPYIAEWKFKSDFSDIILDAGINSSNPRTILFNIGGVTQVKITTGLFNVCGTLRANEVKVDLQGGCDFVFKRDYKLMDLNKLEEFVKTNQHLPEIAPEKEMVENGVNMKELQMKLLQKIEELTLYTIEQNKQNEQQSDKIKALEEKIAKLEAASR